MNTHDSLDILRRLAPKAEPDKPDDEEDMGPCAGRAKDRLVPALTIKHPMKAWESFQYVGIGTHSTYTPTKFEIVFVGDADRWRLTVTGRNLWVIYTAVICHRCEWLRAADRDFAPDGQPIILTADVVEIKDGKAAAP